MKKPFSKSSGRQERPMSKHTRRSFRALARTLLFVLACMPALRARGQTPEGVEHFAELGDFKLVNGKVIQDFRLGYRTFGKLNDDKSNAILWPTWLGGTTQDLLPYIGPGKVVDYGKYFVILVDAIGNGVTTSPSNSKRQPLGSFPEFSIEDMAESEHRLVTEVLRLQHLRAVMGISMGGMQTYAWTQRYPEFMELRFPLWARRNRPLMTNCFGSRRSTPSNRIRRGMAASRRSHSRPASR